jgi:hypothetical protein
MHSFLRGKREAEVKREVFFYSFLLLFHAPIHPIVNMFNLSSK